MCVVFNEQRRRCYDQDKDRLNIFILSLPYRIKEIFFLFTIFFIIIYQLCSGNNKEVIQSQQYHDPYDYVYIARYSTLPIFASPILFIHKQKNYIFFNLSDPFLFIKGTNYQRSNGIYPSCMNPNRLKRPCINFLSRTSLRDSTERVITMVKDMGLCGQWDCETLNQWRMFRTFDYNCQQRQHSVPCKLKTFNIAICRGNSAVIQTKFMEMCVSYIVICV